MSEWLKAERTGMDRRDIKVAVYTTQQRDIRVIGIVLTHIKSASYSFTVVPPGAAEIDVALVDANEPHMLLQLKQAIQRRTPLQVPPLVAPNEALAERVEELDELLADLGLDVDGLVTAAQVMSEYQPAAQARGL